MPFHFFDMSSLSRYGKFLVLDLLDVDGLWAGVQQRMDLVQKDLLKDIMDMSLIRDNKSVCTVCIHIHRYIIFIGH